MWLFTKHGFYSVVQDKKDSQRIQIRARVKGDIERLVAFTKNKFGADAPEVISTPKADYAYRIVIDKTLWKQIATSLAADIDYTNFKDAVHGEPDRDSAYLDIWATMNDLQRRRKKIAG